MIHYDPATSTFHDAGIPGVVVPDDAIAITPARHAQLLEGLAAGRAIVIDAQGRPQLTRGAATLDTLRAHAVLQIRAEARRRILQVASEQRQLNDVALIARAALLRLQPSIDGAAVDAALARLDAIDAIRAASNAAQDAVATLSRARLEALDPTTLFED